MKTLEKLYSSFVSAWDLMIDIPLPGERVKPCSYGDRFSEAAMMPVTGVVPGMVLAALGLFCRGTVAGSIIWAFAALSVMEMINSGRSGKLAADKFSAWIFRNGSETFVSSAVTLLMLFKLAALFTVSYSCNTGFMVVFFVLLFSVQMYCATFPEERAIISVEEEMKRYLYVFPAVVIFIWFWSNPAAVLVSVCAAVATVIFFRKKVWREEPVLSGDDVTLAAGFMEVILLLCAIIFPGI